MACLAEDTVPDDFSPGFGCKNLFQFLLQVLNAPADRYIMNTMQTEMAKVAQATTQTILAIDPSLPRSEQVARIRAALATLAGIAEE